MRLFLFILLLPVLAIGQTKGYIHYDTAYFDGRIKAPDYGAGLASFDSAGLLVSGNSILGNISLRTNDNASSSQLSFTRAAAASGNTTNGMVLARIAANGVYSGATKFGGSFDFFATGNTGAATTPTGFLIQTYNDAAATNLSQLVFRDYRLTLPASGAIAFNVDNNVSGNTAPDIGIGRTSAGLMEINNGSLGTLRDLSLRKLNAAGEIKSSGSNADLVFEDRDLTGRASLFYRQTDITRYGGQNSSGSYVYPIVMYHDAPTGSMEISATGALKFGQYTAGVLKSNGSGNITSGAIAQSDVTGLSASFGAKADTANVLKTIVLGSNVANSTTTIANVTGLSFPVANGGNYRFRFYIFYTSGATTTGSRWSINGPGGSTVVRFRTEQTLDDTNRSFNEGLTAYGNPAAANASSLAAANVAIIEGVINAGADGSVIARFASEVGSSTITAIGGVSYVEYMKIN